MRRYPVVNLGGMLDDYRNEINSLKTKLNTGGYMQPGPNIINQPTPPPPTGSPGTTGQAGTNGWSSGYTGPITVSTGAPPPPPPPPETLPPYPPNTVSTGIPPQSGTIPYIENPNNPYPPVPPPPQEPCPPGYTWTPSGCLPNVPSQDRNPSRYQPPPPSIVSEPPPPSPTPTGTLTPSGGGDRIYRGGGLPGGLPGGLFSGGEVSTPAAGINLTGRIPFSGAPALLRPIKLRGY